MNRKKNHRRTVLTRKIAAFALLAALLFSLGACGTEDGSQKTVTVDKDALAQELLNNVPFKDQMSEVDSAVFYMLYGVTEEQVDSAVMISGTGATAEEIAVIHAASPDHMDALLEAVDQRIQSQRDSFENYVPAEMNKLAEPVIAQLGDYVVVCISDDNEKAENIIRQYESSGVN